MNQFCPVCNFPMQGNQCLRCGIAIKDQQKYRQYLINKCQQSIQEIQQAQLLENQIQQNNLSLYMGATNNKSHYFNKLTTVINNKYGF